MAADDSILLRIASGEPGALAECIARYSSLLWSLARSMLRNPTDAEDALQDIYIELWKSAPRFDPNAGPETAFVRTIARRKLIDRLRAQGRRPAAEELDGASLEIAGEEVAQASSAVDVNVAASALGRLESSQREVLLMSVVQEMSHSEISVATGRPLGTVKAQLRRGLIKLRALIEEGDRSARNSG